MLGRELAKVVGKALGHTPHQRARLERLARKGKPTPRVIIHRKGEERPCPDCREERRIARTPPGSEGTSAMEPKIKDRAAKVARRKSRMPVNGIAMKRLLVERAAKAQKEKS